MFKVKVVLKRKNLQTEWAPVEILPQYHEFMGLLYNARGLNDQTTEGSADGLQITFTHTWETEQDFINFQADNKSVVDHYVDTVTAYYANAGIEYNRTTEAV